MRGRDSWVVPQSWLSKSGILENLLELYTYLSVNAKRAKAKLRWGDAINKTVDHTGFM